MSYISVLNFGTFLDFYPLVVFYARKQLLLSARLSHRNSVRLSVCPSKSYTGFRLAPNSMTLNDLERQNKRFYGFLAISGCDTSLYHSQAQGGATVLTWREHPNLQLNY